MSTEPQPAAQGPAISPTAADATPPRAPGPGSELTVLILLAHELTEMRMHLGLDPDGSGTFDRLLGKLGAYEQIAGVLAPGGAVYDPSSRAARASLRAALRRHAPVISRLARG